MSGRQAAVARRIVGLGEIAYIGNHGTEVLEPGMSEPVIDRRLGPWQDTVHEFATEQFAARELAAKGIRLEDKSAIFGLHYRGVPDETGAEAVLQEVAREAEQGGFVVQWGRKALEIRPPVPFSKADGIRFLLHRHEHIRIGAFAGDDITDVDAMEGLQAAVCEGRLDRAVSIGVASEDVRLPLEERADILVNGVGEMQRLLALCVLSGHRNRPDLPDFPELQ